MKIKDITEEKWEVIGLSIDPIEKDSPLLFGEEKDVKLLLKLLMSDDVKEQLRTILAGCNKDIMSNSQNGPNDPVMYGAVLKLPGDWFPSLRFTNAWPNFDEDPIRLTVIVSAACRRDVYMILNMTTILHKLINELLEEGEYVWRLSEGYTAGYPKEVRELFGEGIGELHLDSCPIHALIPGSRLNNVSGRDLSPNLGNPMTMLEHHPYGRTVEFSE